MKENINLHISQGAEDGKPVTLYLIEGKSPEPFNQIQTIWTGDIDAVKNFIDSRTAANTSFFDKSNCVIIFNEENKQILLVTNDTHPQLGYSVKAQLEEYPELEAFGINQEKYFSLREMEKHIKMNKVWFSDSDKHKVLLEKLNSFNAKIQSEIKDFQDNRANKDKSFSKTVTTDLAAEFTLSIPIFKGSEKSTFPVEICYEAMDASVRFWLESVDLFELQRSKLTEVFGVYKAEFKKAGFTVINQ